MRPLLLSLALLSLLSCGGDNFDTKAFPESQVSTEMAYKRLKNHGAIEPVIEEEASVDGWQFYVTSSSKSSIMGSEPLFRFGLKDQSGIHYEVTSQSSPEVMDKISIGTYGFAKGTVLTVKRDLSAGEVEAELALTDWTPRQ
jgi:hypothetical protein